MGGIDLGLYPCPCLCPLGLLTYYGLCVFTVKLLWTVFDKLMPPPTPFPTLTSRPPIPLATLPQNWYTPQKNDLKWPKIKQVTTSKLCYNKFNRLISPVLQNKVA